MKSCIFTLEMIFERLVKWFAPILYFMEEVWMHIHLMTSLNPNEWINIELERNGIKLEILEVMLL